MWPRQAHMLEPLNKLTFIKINLNGRKLEKMLSAKLSGLWPAILY